MRLSLKRYRAAVNELLGLIAVLGTAVFVAYVVVADGDLDFGQRDSVQYYAVGSSLAGGDGLTVPFSEPGGPLDLGSPKRPLSFYPPGLPLTIAPILAAGVPFQVAMLLLQGSFIAALGMILAWHVQKVTGSTARGVLAGAAGWAAGLFLGDQFLTEPLYLVLVSLAIGCFAGYARRDAVHPLPGVGVAWAMAATLVRLIGVALIAPGIASLAIAREANRRMVGRMAILGGLIAAPALIWILYTSEDSYRAMAWHPPSLVDLKVGVSSLSVWFAPIQIPLEARVVLATGVVVALLVFSTRVRTWVHDELNYAVLWFAYALGHAVILVVVMSVADAQTSLIERQMAPIGLALTIGFIASVPQTKLGNRLVLTIAIAVVGLGAAGFAYLADESGYAEQPWTSSGVFELIRESGTDYVFSNSPEAIWVNTGLSTYAIPTRINPWTGLPNPDLATELGRLREVAKNENVLVIYFEDVARQYLVDIDTLLKAGLTLEGRLDDATVLRNSVDG